MLVIITTIAGLLSSAIPVIFRYFETKQKYKFELELATLKLEAAMRNAEIHKDIKNLEGTFEDIQRSREADSGYGNSWMEIIRSSVRPFITYCCFSLFYGVKVVTAIVLLQSGLTIENMEAATKIILDETTISIITIIVGFYFGSRLLNNEKK